MDAHEKLVGWLFLEGIVVVSAAAAVAVFSLRKWIFPAFRNFPEDMYLNAVAYPSAAAVVGAVVGVGVAGFFGGNVLGGAVYVFAGLIISVGIGGMIARDRAKDEEKPLDSFSVEEWRRDLDYLRGLRRISSQERREFEERARELAAHGEQERKEARRRRFRAYWRCRRRRLRVLAYVWFAAGVYVAVNQAVVMHSPWYLASSLTGGSVILAVWFGWRDERMVKSNEGSAQVWASERIRQWLQRLPDTPVPSLRQRLAMLISPGKV